MNEDLDLEMLVDPARTLGAAKESVVAELVALCERTASFDARELLVEEIEHATWLLLVRKDAAAVGFALATLFAVDQRWVLYLNFMVFAPEARGRGLLNGFIEDILRRTAERLRGSEFYLVSLSGNPLIVGAVHHYPLAYPRPGRPTPADHQEAAQAVARRLYPHLRFDREPPVVRKISPQDTSMLARHRDPRVNAFCDRHLDYAAGDELVLVGRIGRLQRWAIYLVCRAAMARAWARRRFRAS